MAMVDTTDSVIVAFSHEHSSFEQRKVIIVKIADSSYAVSLNVINADIIPYQMHWNVTNGLRIAGLVSYTSTSGAIHILNVTI